MTKLFYIQPILTSYRKDLVSKLSGKYELTMLFGTPTNNSGFHSPEQQHLKTINCPQKSIMRGRLLIQSGILDAIRTYKPDIVLTCANMRDITYWRLLFLCRKMKIKVFSHGQGLYSKKHTPPLLAFLYRSAVRLSYKYICYTAISRDSLISANCAPEKLEVADNTIKFSVDAGDTPKRGDEQGVLFIGRLREQCGLEDLIKAVAILRKSHATIILHVVGSGELEPTYRAQYKQPWIVFHGAIYDDEKTLELSRDCRVGCYPGNAGLSVVHYFSLRLPPILHDDIHSHMGPEPSYVRNGSNGITFQKKRGHKAMSEALLGVWKLPTEEYLKISDAAFSEYERLNAPSMETKMLHILSQFQEEDAL
ncbi:glycosyltransferase [Pseudomonas sp. TWR2-1-1]|uniref:glycosyltransferase n=1 Tax=Pseudomonas sp. TWR2-1-1 TaxID=2804610 RepID=UPI003CE848F1